MGSNSVVEISSDTRKVIGSNPICPTTITNPSDMTVATRCGRMAVVLRLNRRNDVPIEDEIKHGR